MLLADTLVVIGLATASLGTIKEADGIQEHTFWLRNAGKHTVTLKQGYTSCGCTTIQFAQGKGVMPGDSTKVTLRFNPRGKGGEFEEVGTIVYATGHPKQAQTGSKKKSALQLTLTGTCITSEETLMRQFPIRVNDHLRLSANRFDLGIMHVGESKERHVTLLHQDEGNRRETLTVKFTVDKKTLKGLQHITKTVKSRGQTIQIQFDVLIK